YSRWTTFARSRALFFECYRDHRDLHSFPTRRSSDLLKSGWSEWEESATDSMSQVKSAATQTFDGIAQNMAAMLTGSEQNWRSFTRSVLSMMTEILLKGCLTSASTAWGARMTSGCPMV